MTAATALIVRRFREELWNGRSLDVAAEIFASDCVTHQLTSNDRPEPSDRRTPADVRAELQGWFAAFPDLTMVAEQETVCGAIAVTRYLLRGTHRATWFGIPATDRQVAVRMIHTVRVEDGRIQEDWLLADWHGMLEQLGLVPSIADLLTAGGSTTS